MMLTTVMLSSLTKTIEAGRPLNALLTASEYLDGSSPLFSALVRLARPLLNERRYRAASVLIEQVMSGRRLAQFTFDQRAALSAISEGSVESKRYRAFIPVISAYRPMFRVGRIQRAAQRTRVTERFPGATQRVARRIGVV